VTDVRWGLVSTARINRALIAGIRAAGGAQLVAVASRDGATASAYADSYGIPEWFGSYEGMLESDAVDVVYIPLPNSLHVEWSVRALEAGKHVLCEKPMARRVSEVERAFDAAERADRLVMEAFMWRYHDQTAVIERLVREGAIGDVRSVRAEFSFALASDSGDLRWDPELEGGALMDVGCYCVSGLRLLLGEPLRVSAESVIGGPGEGVDARMGAVLRFDGDVLGSFECGIDSAARSLLEVVGGEGRLITTDPWHGGAPDLVRVSDDGVREPLTVAAVDPYAREVEDFSRAVVSGEAPRLGREDAVAQARVIEALYASADSGRAVDVAG
jgi:D-xylose 1-dehydrogenase (NADP+, D-xylono-1,5-lactone-forming)